VRLSFAIKGNLVTYLLFTVAGACSTGVARGDVTDARRQLTAADWTAQRRYCFAQSRRRLTGNSDVIDCHVTRDVTSGRRPRDVITHRRLLSPACSIPTSRSRTTLPTGYKGAQAFRVPNSTYYYLLRICCTTCCTTSFTTNRQQIELVELAPY